MALVYQLDMFQDKRETHLSAVEEWIKALEESQHRVRKGTYAKLNEQGNKIDFLIEKVDFLERHICRGSESQMSTV